MKSSTKKVTTRTIELTKGEVIEAITEYIEKYLEPKTVFIDSHDVSFHIVDTSTNDSAGVTVKNSFININKED